MKRISKALAVDKPTPKAKPKALPKTPAACADLLYKTRTERLALQKQVAALEEVESTLKEYFINTLPKSDATGISGKLAQVRIDTKQFVMVEDKAKLYAHIVKDYKKNREMAFAILQGRIADGVVKEMWAHGTKIPGLTPGDAKVVSCTKL